MTKCALTPNTLTPNTNTNVFDRVLRIGPVNVVVVVGVSVEVHFHHRKIDFPGKTWAPYSALSSLLLFSAFRSISSAAAISFGRTIPSIRLFL